MEIPAVPELRKIPSDIPIDTPGAPPPTPDQTEGGGSHTDDEGLGRLVESTATDPHIMASDFTLKTLLIALKFASESAIQE